MNKQSKILVQIYEDEPSFLFSLTKLINSYNDMELVGALPNANNVLKDVELGKPDVVLLDINLPGKSGREALKEIRFHYPDIEIIMITVFDDRDNIFDCILSGASGYLLKTSSPGKIIEAIREVKEGGAPMTPVVAKKVLQLIPQAVNPTKESVHLTPREVQVLSLLTKGYSYKRIATKLMISHDTVRYFIRCIYKKLHVNSSLGAVTKAINQNLL